MSYSMKRIALFTALIVWACWSATAQLTIRVVTLPVNTPAGDQVYIAGTFNGWNPGNPAFILNETSGEGLSITLNLNPGTIQYKFTRGSWETVEGTSAGNYIPNRTYAYSGGVDTIEVTIAGWENHSGPQHTAAENVHIISEDFFMPQLNRTRRIWIYLPPDYETSDKRYPVIYMQDGQNLFDAYYSFSGEWEVDESMNKMFDEGDKGAIVVGIDNGGALRIDEYSPWVNSTYGGGEGRAYVDFLTETLKPWIDANYRTSTDPGNTAIAGSSMGGFIAMYAAIERQDIFGKAGIFSPSFWFSDSIYMHVADHGVVSDLDVYFVASHNESATMVPHMLAMYETLVQAGLDAEHMYFLSHTDGAHSEWYWAREYPAAYDWLFREIATSAQSSPGQVKQLLYPNPVDGQLHITPSMPRMQYVVYAVDGRQLISGTVLESPVDTSGLVPGLYFLEVLDPDRATGKIFRFVKR